MISNNNYMKITISIFVLITILIWSYKPSIMFRKDGSIKEFGVGKDKTVYYYPFILIIIGIISYIIVSLLKNN